MDLGFVRDHRDPDLPMAGGSGPAGRSLGSVLAIHVDRSVAGVFGLWMLVGVT